MSINPLLAPGLPRFSDIQAADVSPALDVLIEQAQAAVAAAETAEPSWDTTVAALDDSMERFAHAWSTVEHLLSVVDRSWSGLRARGGALRCPGCCCCVILPTQVG